MTTVLIGAVVAIATAAATSAVQSWLNARASVNSDLREERVKAYAIVWEKTRVFSTWPRAAPTRAEVRTLHGEFRDWYFATGGIYLSEHARYLYGETQKLLSVYLNDEIADPDTKVDDDSYELLRASCSAFRTAMTEDIESRRQRSIIETVVKWKRHRKERRDADTRQAALKHSRPDRHS